MASTDTGSVGGFHRSSVLFLAARGITETQLMEKGDNAQRENDVDEHQDNHGDRRGNVYTQPPVELPMQPLQLQQLPALAAIMFDLLESGMQAHGQLAAQLGEQSLGTLDLHER